MIWRYGCGPLLAPEDGDAGVAGGAAPEGATPEPSTGGAPVAPVTPTADGVARYVPLEEHIALKRRIQRIERGEFPQAQPAPDAVAKPADAKPAPAPQPAPQDWQRANDLRDAMDDREQMTVAQRRTLRKWFARESPRGDIEEWIDERLEDIKSLQPAQPTATPATPATKEPSPPAPSTNSGPPAQAHEYLGDDPFALSPEVLDSLPNDKLDAMIRDYETRTSRNVNPDKVRRMQQQAAAKQNG